MPISDRLTVSYFSAGVSSAVATKLMIDQIDHIMYTHIQDQHPDSLRFVRDCEKWFGKPVQISQSPLKSVENVCRLSGFIRARTGGARCTTMLKRHVRKEFEESHRGAMRIVWGMDCHEQERCNRLVQAMSEFEHSFPLLERGITKEDAHKILAASGIKRPAMYDLGYHNNNCIGCVKGGMGYWNKIRQDFPAVFASRAKMERDIGFSILGRAWLDELDPERGRHEGPICEDCGIMCEIMALPGQPNRTTEAPEERFSKRAESEQSPPTVITPARNPNRHPNRHQVPTQTGVPKSRSSGPSSLETLETS